MGVSNEKLCDERHNQIKDDLTRHEKRLNSHSDDIEVLKISDSKHNQQIDNLIEKIDQILTQNRWFIGLVITQLAGFFFLVLNKKLFP